MRLGWLIGALIAALVLATLSVQGPRPLAATAPDHKFSAARAMINVREMAQRPHPVGSADHARVRHYLERRLRDLGLQTEIQTAPLSEGSARRLERSGGDPAAADYTISNLIGVLPGSDPTLPAVALMAHYDTVVGSPGAADDAAGLAAILETIRAAKARNLPGRRTLVVIFTDAEELGLDGARAFWGGHRLRDRIGAVINLEARGGGGRAMMFETGPGNAGMIGLFAQTARRSSGGVTSNSLAVFIYRLMPNGSDFTVPRERGVQGINLAFIGRPEQYHAPSSTLLALDPGSVQHIGDQLLETTDTLLIASRLPAATRDSVYSDVFGRILIAYPEGFGWLLLAAALAAWGVAVWRTRRNQLTLADSGRGAIDALWFVSAGVVATQAVRGLGGPLAQRADSADVYYTLLARLPWLEAGAALCVLAVALAVIGGRTRPDRRVVAGGLVLATLAALTLGGPNPVVIGAGLLATGLSWFPRLSARTLWGGWSGAAGVVLALAFAAQAFAPATAFLFVWPALAAAIGALGAAFRDPGLQGRASLFGLALAAAAGSGWLMALAHPIFLGVGVDLPAVFVLIGLLILILVRPLSPAAGARGILMAAAAIMILACGVSFTARLVHPTPGPALHAGPV